MFSLSFRSPSSLPDWEKIIQKILEDSRNAKQYRNYINAKDILTRPVTELIYVDDDVGRKLYEYKIYTIGDLSKKMRKCGDSNEFCKWLKKIPGVINLGQLITAEMIQIKRKNKTIQREIFYSRPRKSISQPI